MGKKIQKENIKNYEKKVKILPCPLCQFHSKSDYRFKLKIYVLKYHINNQKMMMMYPTKYLPFPG